MSIRLVPNNLIDRAAWDQCVSQSVNGTIYAYSWYLDLVCDSWDALVEGEYEIIFPLPHRKKFGINYLYQPFFTQQLGIFSIRHLTPGIVNAFLEAIPRKYLLVEINLNTFNRPSAFKYNLIENQNFELDLIEPYENLRLNYAQNTIRNINRARRNQVSIAGNAQPEDIVSLFRNNTGRKFKHITDNDYKRLIRLIYECLHNRKAICYGAFTKENTLCAGAIIVFSHRKAIFLFSGTNEIARNNGAMSLLIDHFIKNFSGNHLTLDFEGSNDANLARFYSSFGSTRVTYPSIRLNNFPSIIRFGIKMAKALRGKLTKNTSTKF